MRNYLLLGWINCQTQRCRSSETFCVVICEAVASDATTCVHCTCETTDHTARFPMWSSWILFVSPANVSRCGRGSRGSASVTCLHLKVRSCAKRSAPCVCCGKRQTRDRRERLKQELPWTAEGKQSWDNNSSAAVSPRRSSLTAGWMRQRVGVVGLTGRRKGIILHFWSLFCWEE